MPQNQQKPKRQKSVQIPYELFWELLKYHLCDDYTYSEEIKQGLYDKLDSMVSRKLYTQFKGSESPSERFKALQAYIDHKE